MCECKVAKRKVAALGLHIDPQASWMIIRGYVDGGSGGGDSKDVDRLVGEEVWDNPANLLILLLYLGSWCLEISRLR